MISSASHELVSSMSDIVWAINPQKDHLSDLVLRMRRFASDVFTARNIDFRFRAPDKEHDVRLGANLRREVFLVFKESVNNIARHSGCTETEVDFQTDDEYLTLTVSDNGKGFDVSIGSDGHGLTSMRERASAIGGEFQVTSSPGFGTTVSLKIPINPAL
jgi:signal transduction histidine kinase